MPRRIVDAFPDQEDDAKLMAQVWRAVDACPADTRMQVGIGVHIAAGGPAVLQAALTTWQRGSIDLKAHIKSAKQGRLTRKASFTSGGRSASGRMAGSPDARPPAATVRRRSTTRAVAVSTPPDHRADDHDAGHRTSTGCDQAAVRPMARSHRRCCWKDDPVLYRRACEEARQRAKSSPLFQTLDLIRYFKR
jgi:hypothetical protein